jgi:hypothetical protein
MYKQYISMGKLVTEAIIRTSDNACIPFVDDNTDYIAYKKWLAEGNEPLPAEENT